MDVVGKIVALDATLTHHEVPHAFGGALALAWCTQQARGTIDIDLNIFSAASAARTVCAALPADVVWSDDDVAVLERDGQVRLRWDGVPVDIFLNTTDFHEQLASRIRFEEFGGRLVPFLSCTDLAVFKAFFNRSKDWVDLEEMLQLGSVDVDVVLGVLVNYLGGADERIERLRQLAREVARRSSDHSSE
jgi:hypothetical protein